MSRGASNTREDGFLGRVNAGWRTGALRHYVRVREGQVDPSDASVADLTLIAPNHVESSTGRLLQVESAAEQGAESGKYWCDAGDVIYSKIRPALRKVVIAPHDCLCSADMYPLKGVNGLSNRFLYWYLLSEPFSDFALQESARVAMPKLNRETLAAAILPLPSPSVQERIVNFLDEQTTRIDALIAEKERLAELVVDYCAAQIEVEVSGRKVTGLKSRTSFDFCPELPQGWVMRRLKHISPEIVVGIVVNPSNYYSDQGRPFVFGGDIQEDGIRGTTTRRISDEGNSCNPKSRLRAGDLLTVRVGEPGVTAVVPAELDGANCASVMLTRGSPTYISAWLAACMNSTIGRHQVKLVEYGAAMKQFNISHAREFWFPVPPRSEQIAIAAAVEAVKLRTRGLTRHAREHIDRLREYRSSLISAAVTGQLDISTFREAA